MLQAPQSPFHQIMSDESKFTDWDWNGGTQTAAEAPPRAPAPAPDVAKFAVSVFLCRCSDRRRISSAGEWGEGHKHGQLGHEEREERRIIPPELIICLGLNLNHFLFPGRASVIFSAGTTLESQDFKQRKAAPCIIIKKGLVWSRRIKAEDKGGYLNFHWLLELIGA